MATKKKKVEAPVIVETRMFSDMNEIFFDTKLVNQAVLVLASDVTPDACAEVMSEIIELNFIPMEDRPDVINLLITSHGGDMDSAIALINVINGSHIPVRTIAVGTCASAALCILMSGHMRVITPWCGLMSHQFSTGMSGTFNDLKNAASEFNTYYEKMVDIYVTFTDLPKERIESELLNHRDVFLTPESAIKYNIADTICGLN